MNDFQDKSDLEKALLAGVHGVPELRREEKRRFLGFFRERVIEAITFEQLRAAGLAVMLKALKDERAVELVIHKNARGGAMPLIIQAQRQGLNFTIVSNPDFIGEVSVVLAAAEAVDTALLMAEKN